ncbi:SLAIN motif-containing family protein [Aspergillus parasiticus SU-1]|uniref:SLAIN motif-containing family protein n=1 Tax=Aspergillus parasiticus (strain ATCC 56775 / NRRL 5862 / SRRC 143 / SU-1) TaxID=1403190 RepID=A0A0F0I6G6_ASPPU|nr:SLAIN motif-containing family protein [Aspergillus parasiticus SU-1]
MGWVYNLEKPDPHSDFGQVIAICLVFTIAAFLAIVLRFYIRIHTKRSLWLDDYAALYSAIMVVGYCASSILQTRWGLGLHAEYFPTANVKQFSKVQYVGGPFYAMSLLGFKVSLLASYLRIGGFVKVYRTIIIVAIVAVVVNQVIFTFLFIFPCRPVWNPRPHTTLAGSHSRLYDPFVYCPILTNTGTSLGFDIVIIALPLPVLWNLQLGTRQKVALCCVFAIGFFVTIIQIIRIFTIARLKTYTDSKPVILWSIIEISLAVIIACVPTYGPYFRVFVSNISSYRRRPTGQDYPLTSGNRQTRASSRKFGLSSLGRDDAKFDRPPVPRPYDNSTPHTTTISSKVTADNDSEELILGNANQGMFASVGEQERGIQKVMEVTVERH